MPSAKMNPKVFEFSPRLAMLYQLTTKILKQNSNRHERIELWAVVSQKYQTFRGLRTSFPPRDIRKKPRSMYASVPQAMAQFVLKIEKLSHIMETAPLVELARAYGLHPRLWLLLALEDRNLFLDRKPNQSGQVLDGFQEDHKGCVRLFTGKDNNNNFHQLFYVSEICIESKIYVCIVKGLPMYNK